MNNDILLFYGWWQFAVCLFAFVALMAIWRNIGRRQNDFGQVWLALSVLCWSISGIIEIYFASIEVHSSTVLDGWRSILSLLNSLFILLALPWFRYLPEAIAHIIKSKYWVYIVGVPFVFSIVPTLNRMVSGNAITMMTELDVYYAIFTLGFLGFVLWESFSKRRLKALAWLSLVCIAVVLVAQMYKLSGYSINLTLYSAIFKTSLIMLFFALALSWVKELSENIIPDTKDLYVYFEKNKNDAGKYEHYVSLKGLPGNHKRKIKLTPASYDLFLKFAHKRKSGEDWLEIKPKSYKKTENNFDINDYNEVKRLLVSLLDGMFGKQNWTDTHHLNPLKNTLFEMSEKRDRKIRLIVPIENIFS
ncbi:hypothetical protein ACFO3O_19320 [Dokdonia ponticola]|uniref:Histidine kinase N-terminal 7TM region domain-containing protein n=1 Tax=Dokdonia ponticola TaxID=2041041 RepID=A0ABV9I1N9_9FLAO